MGDTTTEFVPNAQTPRGSFGFFRPFNCSFDMLDMATHRATAQDYAALPEGAPFQLIDFELVMSPSPTSRHQRILKRLFLAFEKHLEAHGGGDIEFAPFDVHFGEGDVYQPNAFVILDGNPGIMEDNGFHGVPDIIIEVLSPSNAYYDLRHKKMIYEQTGVKEYWIVDPIDHIIECHSNTEKGFEISSMAHNEGEVQSGLLPGFSVMAESVFRK